MNPVLAAFLLYAVFILLPLLPAIIIYKMFPNTQVGANGLLGNLKINATGAFAAYIITSVMSFFLVQYIQETIEGNSSETDKSWTVYAKVKFVDEKGEPIISDTENLINMTQISIKPDPFFYKSPDFVKFEVTA
jgi:hypothetical protein